MFIKCISGNENSCGILDLYVAVGILEERLGRELNLAFDKDVDPDGAAASNPRFFPVNDGLLAAQVPTQLDSATTFRAALSKMVAAVDKEIEDLKKIGKEAR